MNNDVSIIIRALNEAEMIGETLAAINDQQREPDEVIVVDCHSTDGTPDIARDHGATVLKMHPNEFTYGRGINYGVEHADGRYLVILSAHAVPTTDAWLGSLVDAISTDGVAGAYGKQVSTPDSDPLEARSLRASFGDQPHVQTDDPFFSNANSIIDRLVWQSYKFDEELPYSEDHKWASGVQDKGYEICYVPDAEVIHTHEETVCQVFDRNRNQGHAATLIGSSETLSLPWTILRIGSNICLDWMYILNNRRSPKQLFRSPIYRAAEGLGFYMGIHQNNSR